MKPVQVFPFITDNTMKKIVFALSLLFGVAGAYAQTSETEAKPEFKFVTTEHDFQKIKEGTMAAYEFKFTNTGKAPLILTNVQPSCGCTTPEWPKEPIAPGASAKVKAVYNSYGRPGSFEKYITVKSNAGPDIVLRFRGTVESTPPEPQSPVRNPNVE